MNERKRGALSYNDFEGVSDVDAFVCINNIYELKGFFDDGVGGNLYSEIS